MNPSLKAGNPKPRKNFKGKKNYKDAHMQKIARKEAKKVMNKELESKTYDEELTAPTGVDSATGVISSLIAGIARGTGESEFIGDCITPTHIRVRGALIGGDDTNVIRVVLLQYKQAGSTPALATLFAGSTGFSYLSPFQTNYSTIYNVLYDEMYTTVGNGTQGYAAENSALLFDIRIPMKKLRKVHFTGSAAVSAGDIFLVLCSDSASGGHPTVRYSSRIYYKDA